MISRLNLSNIETAQSLLRLQHLAYKQEALLLGFDQLSPLLEGLSDVMQTEVEYWGYWFDNELLGAIAYYTFDEVLDIHRLMVHPNYFGRSIAHRLFKMMENINPQARSIIAQTGKKNAPACRFYEKQGMHIIDEISLFYGRLVLVTFEKKIPPILME